VPYTAAVSTLQTIVGALSSTLTIGQPDGRVRATAELIALALAIAGFVLLTIAAFHVERWAGFAAAGVSCLIVEHRVTADRARR
jgi:hypothetical protein